MTFLVFVFIVSILVLVHELGHFLVARKFGIKVEEFGIGYPPRALSLLKDKHGTIYSLNWLPFGGFVKLYGEEGQELADRNLKGSKDQIFYLKSKKVRLMVVAAGALMNFLFGAIAFGAIYTKTGIPSELEYVQIDEVVSGAPADQAGLLSGDKVFSLSSDNQVIETPTVNGFIDLLAQNRGEEVTFNIERGDQNLNLSVYVRQEAEVPPGQGAVGVAVSDIEFRFFPLWQMPLRGAWVGLKSAVAFGVLLLVALGTMFKDLIFSGVVPPDVAGPIGIIHLASRENLLTSGLLSVLNFAGILSINLAIVNMLPFPALDGGRALFIMIEKAIGGRLKPKLEYWANMTGMAILLTLIVLISIRDLNSVFADEAFQNWFQGLLGVVKGG